MPSKGAMERDPELRFLALVVVVLLCSSLVGAVGLVKATEGSGGRTVAAYHASNDGGGGGVTTGAGGGVAVTAGNMTRRPFVVLHGINDACEGGGLAAYPNFTQTLQDLTGAPGVCIEIGNGILDSWFMPLEKQAAVLCRKVKQMPLLQDGFNLVALSQGNMVGRAFIEWCEGAPPVHNYVALGGPQAGMAAVPLCTFESFCRIVDSVIRIGVYSPFVQDHLAPAGYVKIPWDRTGYTRRCRFLPRLNNELPLHRNDTYTKRLTALNHLTLVMFEADEVLEPRETAHFGFYTWGTDRVVPVTETDLYKQDWIGLRSLDEAGRVTFLSLPGGHLELNEEALNVHVVPLLV